MSKKNSNDTIGNRSRDLPACSAVPQPTAAPRAPKREITTGSSKPQETDEQSTFTSVDYIFPFLFFVIKIACILERHLSLCLQICAFICKLFLHQVHFICEQSILTSLAASGALVTMESRHHTLHPYPSPEEKTFFD
jgi:hypothetical protein